MARATGLEPATSSVTGRKKSRYFKYISIYRHILATSIDAQTCKDAACRLFVIALQQMPIHVQCGFDIFMPHEGLYCLKVFPVGYKNRRIEMT